MTNKIRSRARQPYDLEDGVIISDVDISSAQGASLFGITPVTGLNSTTLPAVLNEITNSISAPLGDSNLQGAPTAPTAQAGTSNNQLATTAFFQLSAQVVKNLPSFGSITIGSITNTSTNAQVLITSLNGYSSTGLTVQFQVTPQSNPNAFTNVSTPQAFTNISTPIGVNLTALGTNTAYFVRAFLIDSNNSNLNVVSNVVSFITAQELSDADSSYDIVGNTYLTSSVISKSASVDQTSNSTVANSDNAFATTVEIAQQVGQGNFITVKPTISFKPSKFTILPATNNLVYSLRSNIKSFKTGDTLYSLEGSTLFKRTPVSIVSSSKLLNSYRNQNINKATTVADISGWAIYTSLPFSITNPQIVITNSRVYQIGGDNDNTVHYSTIAANGTIGAWTTGPSLASNMLGGNSFVTNSRVYILMGQNNTQVYSAIINPDGSLGLFNLQGLLPIGLSYTQTVVVGNRVYLIGGQTAAATFTSNVYYSIINEDGVIGEWVASGALPAPIGYSTTFVTNSRVYLVGGYTTGNSALNNVYYATINSDGSLGTWTGSPILPTTRYSSQAVMTKDRVFLIGGAGPNPTFVYTASIDTAGVIGTWSQTTTPLVAGITYLSSFVTNSRVFILGNNATGVYSSPFADGWVGVNDTTSIGKTYLSHYNTQNINKTSTVADITGWTTSNSLPRGNRLGVSLVTSSRVYIGFGYIDSNLFEFSGFYAPINADGTLGAFVEQPNFIQVSYTNLSSIVIKNIFYYIGGYEDDSASNNINGYLIDNNGVLIPEVITNASLPLLLLNASCAVTTNKLYIIGGENGSGVIQTGTYYYEINSDGTLAAAITGTSLPGPLTLAKAFTTSSRVYVLGYSGVTSANSVLYYAPINADGTLGTWVVGAAFPAQIREFELISTKDRVFILGGVNNSGVVSNVTYSAPINGSGVVGAFTTGTSLINNLYGFKAAVTNSRVYLMGGTTSGGAASSAVYTAPFADGWQGVNDTSLITYTAVLPSNATAVPTAVYKAGQFSQSSLHLNALTSLNDYSSQNVNKTSTVSTITGWTTAGDIPRALSNVGVVVTSSRVYLIGGSTNTGAVTDVYSAPIDSNGVIGSFTASTFNFQLPIGLLIYNLIVTSNFVHITTAVDSNNTSLDIYSAPIDSNGVLGIFYKSSKKLVGSENSNVAIIKNRVYCFSVTSDDLQTNNYSTYALIGPDGNIGTFAPKTIVPFSLVTTTPLVTSSRVYLLGGTLNGVNTATTQYAPINADGSLGSWANGTSLPAANTNAQIVSTKDRVFLIGGSAAGNVASNAVYTAPIDSNGVVGTWSIIGSLPVTLRYSKTIVTNSRIYFLGGSVNGTTSSAIYYAPFADGWVGINNPVSSSANFVTDVVASETISNDLITITCNQRSGNGRFVQTRLAMNNQDISTQLKAILTV